MEMPPEGSWDVLPLDLEELILGKLSLLEVTRLSTTCRSFHRAFCRQLAQEQKARCALAAGCFGRERILQIKSLISSFLNDDGPDPDLARHSKFEGYICRDGTFRDGKFRSEPQAPHVPGTPNVHAGDDVTYARLVRGHTPGASHGTFIYVSTHKSSHVSLATNGPGEAGFHVIVTVRSDADLEGLALVQALLSADFGPGLQDAGLTELWVKGRSFSGNFSQAGVEAQIAPLVPFMSEFRTVAEWLPEGCRNRKRPQAEAVASAASGNFPVEYIVK
jgi:hypothetical protein